MITRRHTLLAQAIIALLLLLGAGRLGGGARAAQPDALSVVYVPLLASPPAPPTPAPPTPGPPTPTPPGSLPAELVGTWYSGQLLNLTLYDPTTGIWSGAGGLGHMYTFAASGSYTLVSYLKLGEGTTCVSSVAKYEAGAARASGNALLLTPSVSRTRTQVCGSQPPSDVAGSQSTYSLPWRVGEDANSHTKLWLSEAQGVTEYYKDGLAPQVVGEWANGDGGAIRLYDAASGTWAEPSGAGSEWYAFSADGSFRHGVVDAGFGDDPCRPVTMRYEEGVLSGRGGDIIMEVSAALRRTVSPCEPDGAVDDDLGAGGYERWTWAIPANSAGGALDLMRIEGGFRSIRLSRVE
jgi:hypothetical protein